MIRELCAALLLTSSCTLPGCRAKPRASPLAVGDFLRSDYVECVTRTRSPFQCDDPAAPLLVQVRREPGGTRLSVDSFHEGFAELVQRRDGSIEADRSNGPVVPHLAASVPDEHHLKLGFGEFKPSVYAFVGDLDMYVARRALVGKYLDDKGHSYIFGSDGWAVFPGRRFEYVVGTDHVLNSYDYYFEPPDGGAFVFERHDGVLRIFRTSGEIDQIVDKRPSYSLRELASAK